MVKQPLDSVVARAALEECRRQAQKCIDESAKAETPTLRASWNSGSARRNEWHKLTEISGRHDPKHPSGQPMTLGNMREPRRGPPNRLLSDDARRHQTVIDVS